MTWKCQTPDAVKPTNLVLPQRDEVRSPYLVQLSLHPTILHYDSGTSSRMPFNVKLSVGETITVCTARRSPRYLST
jgi:hypothetical protein